MTKFIRFAFLPVFLTFLLSSQVWAAIPNVTGTYKVTGAKYIAPSLASCQGVAITVKITSQCGRLFKGTVSVGSVTMPMAGKVNVDNSIYLQGGSFTSMNTVMLYGLYQASPAAIKVNGDFQTISVPSVLPPEAIMDDFTLAK